MASRCRSMLGKVALLAAATVVLAACETGGLLVVEQKDPEPEGPSTQEMVSGGTFASNAKYRLFYTNGQPTPNQGVSTGAKNRLNGGLAGASHRD